MVMCALTDRLRAWITMNQAYPWSDTIEESYRGKGELSSRRLTPTYLVRNDEKAHGYGCPPRVRPARSAMSVPGIPGERVGVEG